MSAARIEESRVERLRRYANDKRFNQIIHAFVERGVQMFVFCRDANGIRHRIDVRTALPLCCTPIPNDAQVEFYSFTNCVFCSKLGG
jgi:hypothetical protein